MYHPAGFSDEDEDSDFEMFGFETRRHVVQERVRTPDEKLIDAVRQNNVENAQLALDEGADIHFRCSYPSNNSPIMEAASLGHFEMIEWLISRGANIKDDEKMSNVIMCICYSNSDEETLLKCLNLMLDKGVDPRTTDWVGITSLIAAVTRNRQLLAGRLIEFDGDLLEMPDSDGWTPIFHAVHSVNVGMVKFLLDKGAETNVMDRRGRMLWNVASDIDNNEIFNLVAPEDVKFERDEVIEDEEPLRGRSAFKTVMLTVPRRDDPLHGFHEDAISFVRGIGLDAVASHIKKQNLQFAHLLTWSEDDWKKSGVIMNYHLKKLAVNVQKYHEQPWGKNCLPSAKCVLTDGRVDLFQVVRYLLTCIRVAHITSTSSLFVSRRHDGWSRVQLENLLKANSVLEKQVKATRQTCVKIREKSSDPPDLIKKREPVRKSLNLFVVSGLVFIVFFKLEFIKANLRHGIRLIQGQLAID